MFVSDMEKGFQNVNAQVIDLESLSRPTYLPWPFRQYYLCVVTIRHTITDSQRP